MINGEDEAVSKLSDLRVMIGVGYSWPDHLLQDENLLKLNPSEAFRPERTVIFVVKSRTEACRKSKTDGCESGCWRIMARDKLIKFEDGKILGFKRILKFCEKKKPSEYKRIWVMEQFRLANKWNLKQDHVICKFRFMFQTEICALLAKHFSYRYTTSSDPLPATQLLPVYGVRLIDPQEEDAYYLQTIIGSVGNYWPIYVTNDVYRLDPLRLVHKVINNGICFFANRTETSGRTDGSNAGCWRIMDRDKLIKSKTGKILGFKRVFKFLEKEKKDYVHENGKKVTLTMEEYRLAGKKVLQSKVLCVIKANLSIPPKRRS